MCVCFVASFLLLCLSLIFGLWITKTMGATARVLLDSVRILIIWGIAVGSGWQSFQLLHLVGFVIFLIGILFYYEIICFLRMWAWIKANWQLGKNADGPKPFVEHNNLSVNI
jgi:hypothetical protein